MALQQGLEPLIFYDFEILVLGLFPGNISLAKGEYYSDPNNAFWDVLYGVWDMNPVRQDYNDKKMFLQKHKLALWTIFAQAERNGSTNKETRGYTLADIESLLNKYRTIKKVIFNGKCSVFEKGKHDFKKQYSYFNKIFTNLGISHIVLNSTSGKNTHLTREKKINEWRVAFADLRLV